MNTLFKLSAVICILLTLTNCSEKDTEDLSISAPQIYSLEQIYGSNDIELEWNYVEGATYYNVYEYYNTPWGGWNYTTVTTTDETYTIIEDVTEGNHKYAIKAVDIYGNMSDYSNIRSIYVQNPNNDQGSNDNIIPDDNNNNNNDNNNDNTTQPSIEAPATFIATYYDAAGSQFISLQWFDVDEAVKYKVYRSSSMNGTYTCIATVDISDYIDYSFINGDNYYYVTSISASGEESDKSKIRKVSVNSSDNNNSNDNNQSGDNNTTYSPGNPIYGNCTVSGTKVTLRWSYPTGAGYGTPTTAKLRVRIGDSDAWTTIEELPGTATSVSWNYTSAYVTNIDGQRFLYIGILLENEKGTGSTPRIYNITEGSWVI